MIFIANDVQRKLWGTLSKIFFFRNCGYINNSNRLLMNKFLSEVVLINNLHVVPVLQGHQSVLFGQQVPEIQGTNSILDNNTDRKF